MSTAYYALFHCLALTCADLMVGGLGADRSKPAWKQVYRALQHGQAKKACQNSEMRAFPQEIRDFGNAFVQMQIQRHSADYDPEGAYYKSTVLSYIAMAEDVILRFNGAPIKDRRAFAAFVLFDKRS